MFVLYGDLSLLKRTSRYGRNTWPLPHSLWSSDTSSSIGARTRVSYVVLFRSQNALVFSSSRRSKNSSASAFQPANAMSCLLPLLCGNDRHDVHLDQRPRVEQLADPDCRAGR